jgi:1,4-dihydroxy-2-naphthoate octaprenyltransferase
MCGAGASRGLFTVLLFGPFALLPAMALWAPSPGLLLPLVLLPAAWSLRHTFLNTPPGVAFNGVLFQTFRLELWFATLLSVGALGGHFLR